MHSCLSNCFVMFCMSNNYRWWNGATQTHTHTLHTRFIHWLFVSLKWTPIKNVFSLSSAATVWRFQCRKYNFLRLFANFYDPPMTETEFYPVILDIPPSAVWLQQSSCNGVQNNWNWRWIYANSKNGHKLSTKSSSRIPFVGLDLTEDNIIASNTESNHCSANRSSGSKFPWTLSTPDRTYKWAVEVEKHHGLTKLWVAEWRMKDECEEMASGRKRTRSQNEKNNVVETPERKFPSPKCNLPPPQCAHRLHYLHPHTHKHTLRTEIYTDTCYNESLKRT